MKQLSSNPTADSIAKGWQVMCMCVSTFPPSTEFELYLLNFMHEQKKKKGAIRNYAKYRRTHTHTKKKKKKKEKKKKKKEK